MPAKAQKKIPATFMRGGTSKGLFFDPADLPSNSQTRDSILLRAMGSPDPYSQQIDGMGGGSSSTSKAALVSRSERDGYDLDYYLAAIPIGEAFVDWSGNCGNLAAAVAPFAIERGMIEVPSDGIAEVKIWQVNTGKPIIAHIPMRDGKVQETGDFALDGVAFPAAEVRLDFENAKGGPALFPTGNPVTFVEMDGREAFKATLINAGSPTILVHASALGLTGTELPFQINTQVELLERAESMRAHAAVAMGLAKNPEAVSRTMLQSPKLAFVAKPANYTASDGRTIEAAGIDLVARTFSMGKLHHAMTGTGTVALAAAAAVPGTLVSAITGVKTKVRIGHASGTVLVGSEAELIDGSWTIKRTSFSRSARRLMEGSVFVDCAD